MCKPRKLNSERAKKRAKSFPQDERDANSIAELRAEGEQIQFTIASCCFQRYLYSTLVPHTYFESILCLCFTHIVRRERVTDTDHSSFQKIIITIINQSVNIDCDILFLWINSSKLTVLLIHNVKRSKLWESICFNSHRVLSWRLPNFTHGL